MTETRPYDGPDSFRRSLTDRLRALSKSSRWTLPELQRQIAYDRLLERLYLAGDDWIVKGATALLARDIGVRATVDIDLYRRAGTASAYASLRAAAAVDLDDWFRFKVGVARETTGRTEGMRVSIRCTVGAAVWAAFSVDLVGAEVCMTGEPESVPPLAQVNVPGISQHGYRAYPLVDHIADKIAAVFEVHGESGKPSTRYKDLVDLVAIVLAASVDATAQSVALRSEEDRRGLRLPQRFDVPDHRLWNSGYRIAAARSLLPVGRTLVEALAVVRPFVDPLLDGTAVGSWNPAVGRWSL